MNTHKVIREGIQSLKANRIRSSLSVLGIVFGVAAVVAMLAVVEGARQDVLERLSRLGTSVLFVLGDKEAPESHRQLLYGDALRLEKSSTMITAVAPAILVQETTSANEVEVIGVTPNYVVVRQLILQAGRNISDLDLTSRARVCVIGRGVVGDGGNPVGVGGMIQLGSHAYRVVGVVASETSVKDRSLSSLLRNHNKSALVPVTVMPQIGGIIDSDINISEISVRARRSDDLPQVSVIVDRVLQGGQTAPPATEIVIPRQLLREEQHAQRVFAAVVGCVALIGVLVGGIGVMNIMLANVAERRKEIGIRRAIGATKRQIATLFLMESTLLTFFGGLGGLILGVGASACIAMFGGWSVMISIWSLLLAMSMAGLVGIAAGWYPAVVAASLDPVEAMRRE